MLFKAYIFICRPVVVVGFFAAYPRPWDLREGSITHTDDILEFLTFMAAKFSMMKGKLCQRGGDRTWTNTA
jgi:hypothetical protein